MLYIVVSNKTFRREIDHEGGPLEFGRNPGRNDVPRCRIDDDLFVSKDHLRVEEVANHLVRIENLSAKNPLRLGDGAVIGPGEQLDLDPPLRLFVGDTLVQISAVGDDGPINESLETVIRPVQTTEPRAASLVSLGQSPSADQLMRWFETLISVQRAAAGSAEFYAQTARAVVELVGLDLGLVLLRRRDRWEEVARHGRDSAGEPAVSESILRSVLRDRRTFFQSSPTASPSVSLQGIEAVVASPIFDAADNIAGVVYGLRTRRAGSRSSTGSSIGVGPLEAQVVQLLAAASGAGLARLERQAEASRLRVQFEQFFSAGLARQLEQNPRLLEGQERPITVLFCDIRGFSRLTESLDPQTTCRLIGDVMERMTARVREFDGVIVDYAGDGLCAMWNAPADQPEHAALACRAALKMLGDLPALNDDWRATLGHPLGLGIGVNSGPAMVGNTGSRHKFKYGPLGLTVNLASRVEGATKQLGVPLLITGTTRAQIGEQFAARRLCRSKVVGIDGPVEFFELHGETASPQWLVLKEAYERALDHFESSRWSEACQTLYPLLAGTSRDFDVPTLNLLARAVECLKSPPAHFNPVLELTSK